MVKWMRGVVRLMTIKPFYKYRDELIMKNEDTNKWWITNYFDIEFDTLDQAKNHIDKRIGGFSGKCMPQRWFKDKELKEFYELRKHF